MGAVLRAAGISLAICIAACNPGVAAPQLGRDVASAPAARAKSRSRERQRAESNGRSAFSKVDVRRRAAGIDVRWRARVPAQAESERGRRARRRLLARPRVAREGRRASQRCGDADGAGKQTTLRNGARACAFTFPNIDGKPVSLSDERLRQGRAGDARRHSVPKLP